MLKLLQSVRILIPVVAAFLLCSSFVPAASAECIGIEACSCTKAQSALTVTPDQAPEKKSKKSVLDAEVLDHPFSFFEDAFDNNAEPEVSEHYKTLTLTVKTLIASLLSTII